MFNSLQQLLPPNSLPFGYQVLITLTPYTVSWLTLTTEMKTYFPLIVSEVHFVLSQFKR